MKHINDGFEAALQTFFAVLSPLCITLTLYLHLNGEVSPGGGFAAGIMMSTILIASNIVFHSFKVKLNLIIAVSAAFMCLYLLLAIAGLAYSSSFLDYSVLQLCGLNYIQSQKIGIFIAETCIMLVVACSTYLIYNMLQMFAIKNNQK